MTLPADVLALVRATLQTHRDTLDDHAIVRTILETMGGRQPEQLVALMTAAGGPAAFVKQLVEAVRDQGWLLPTLMDMQRSLGELTQAMRTLTEQSQDDRKKLDKISHQVYAAVVIVTIIVSLVIGVASFVAARWLAEILAR
jgi:hypothetical protein